ncbi:hypothetical protein FLM52_15555 [bacterium Scap17]|nr:hypothetical protein [bacterium Scap17]
MGFIALSRVRIPLSPPLGANAVRCALSSAG